MLMGQNMDFHLLILMPKTKTRDKIIDECADSYVFASAGAFSVCWVEGLPWLTFFFYSLGFASAAIIRYTYLIHAKPTIKRLFSSK